jgi:hypothetical protein
MSLGDPTENNFLKLLLNATAWANVADNAASSPLTNVHVALHTADPAEAGDQTTSEAAYTGYTRVAVARTTGGWTVTNNSGSPVANITFPTATGAHQTLLYFSVGKNLTGASEIFMRGPIGSLQGVFTAGTDDNITIPGHTLVVDDRIAFFSAFGSTLPTGMTEATVYWVKTSATNVVTVSTTQGGTTIDLTAVGRGVAFKVTPLDTSVTTTPVLSTSTTLKVD